MIYLVYAVNFLLMIIMPFVLGWGIARTRGASWRLFGIGAVTFVASQVLHIPFNWLAQRSGVLPSDTSVLSNLLILATFLGLSSGVFEEGARYVTYRFWAKDACTWGRGLMLGAGHGGIEALIIGVLGAVNIAGLYFISQGQLLQNLPATEAALVEQQVQAVLNTPWHGVLLGALERVFSLCFHLSASLLVMQVFVRRPEPIDDGGFSGMEPLPEPTLDPDRPPSLETTAEMLERSRYN